MLHPVRSARLSGLLLAGLLAWGGARAAETDSFTVRQEPVPEVTDMVNRRTNELLDEAIAQANAEVGLPLGLDRLIGADGCDRGRLYAAVNDRMGGPLVGTLEQYANTTAPHRRLSRGESIYRAFRVFEAPSLGGEVGRLAAVVNLDGHLIGADKLGHFFSQGYAYFDKAHLQKAGLGAALEYGERSERTYYGALLTGVYSYADLAANFNGMRFWIHLLGEHPDPLGEPTDMPYVSCFRQQWVRNRPFDWRDYVDAAWDEAVNCNRFRNPMLADKVRQAVAELDPGARMSLGCPVTRDPEARLRGKYGRYFARLVNMEGHGVVQPRFWLSGIAGRWASRL